MKENIFGYVGNSMLLTSVQEQCQLEVIPCAETRIEKMFSQVSARRRPFRWSNFSPSAFCLDTMQGSVGEDLYTRIYHQVENMTASSILSLFTHVPEASPEGPCP
jgi:hypothetical protein